MQLSYVHFQMNSMTSHWAVIPADTDMLKGTSVEAQNLKVARDWAGGAGGGRLTLSGTWSFTVTVKCGADHKVRGFLCCVWQTDTSGPADLAQNTQFLPTTALCMVYDGKIIPVKPKAWVKIYVNFYMLCSSCVWMNARICAAVTQPLEAVFILWFSHLCFQWI